MRNLRVGVKIALGFGAVILCLIIIAAVVFISNSATNGNIDDIRDDFVVQESVMEMSEHFWQARLNSRTMFLALENEAYGLVRDALAETYEHIEEVHSHVKSMPHLKDLEGEVSALEKEISNYEKAIDKVNDSNTRLAATRDSALAQQELLIEAADSAYRNQQSLWRKESENSELSYDNKIRRADRLDSTIVFLKDIEAIVTRGAYVFNTFDTSDAEALSAEISRVLDELQAYIDSAQNQGTKDAAQATIDALQPYEEVFFAFCAVDAENKSDTEAAAAQANVAITASDALTNSLNSAMNAAMDSTVTSSSATLVLSIIITALAICMALIIAFVLVRAITRPLNRMRNILVRIGTTGDVVLSEEEYNSLKKDSEQKDEVGFCAAACSELVSHLFTLSNQIDKVSEGDLSVSITAVSDKDRIGNAIKKMVDKLNIMFGDIAASTGQVAVGSKQIADGAQSLAQGSTQQAAAIEQLSASISDIALKTKGNAEMAGKAANLSETIKVSAEKGSTQMGSMMDAVKDINQASQSIGKVIKVIDDIAFQTNILALNAAVEAARAGQHGKGFAVVAEEVRNLAAKSAEAAKDTGGLIANSIEKAELGARIADETSASLSEIVTGINESAQIVIGIAKSSEEQSIGISEINKGIDQVAQVVQQNSATAEQSAAASEEMSGQSMMLEDLIAQFKLRDGVGIRQLPPGKADF